MGKKKIIVPLALLMTYLAGISADFAYTSNAKRTPITKGTTLQSASVESPTQALKVEFDSESGVRSETIFHSTAIVSIVIPQACLLPNLSVEFLSDVSFTIHLLSSLSASVVLRKLLI